MVDAAIRLYRANWKVLMGLMAWILAPFALLQALSIQLAGPVASSANPAVLGSQPSPGQVLNAVFGRTLVVVLVFSLLRYLLITPFLLAAVAQAAGGVYLGREVTVGNLYRAALRRFLPVLGVLALIVVIVVSASLLLIIPGVFFFVRLFLAPIAVMLEDIGPMQAIKRSWHLTRGNWWRSFGMLLLTTLMGYIATAILGVIVLLLSQFAGPVGWVVRGLGGAVTLIILTPFTTIVYTLLYFDLRIRNEGFDLAVLADQLRPR